MDLIVKCLQRTPPLIIIALTIVLLSGFSTSEETQMQSDEPGAFQVHVSAGAYDRVETIVSFYAPQDLKAGVYSLVSNLGKTIPVQVDAVNRGWFIIDRLSAGSSGTFTFNPEQNESSAENNISSEKSHNTISWSSGNNKVLSFYHKENSPPDVLDERYKRGGYIHPVYSPSGVILTNHLNPEQHSHHAGIWSAWTNTEFDGRTPDFWNVHRNSGRVDIDTLLDNWQGPVHGGFKSRSRFIDLSAEEPVVALNEHWEVRIYSATSGDKVHIFDLVIKQTVNTDKPLNLPEYRYGGVGFRGHEDWDDPEKAFFLTSEGLGRNGHGTRARWAHIGGYTDGELAGLAILGHPANYRFPQTMRIHPQEPFFNFAPTQLGDMSIEVGEPYVARYRYVAHDGEPDADLIERLWLDYAYPPGVTVTE